MQAADDPQPAESPVIPRGPVRGAAQLRKQFRGELRRIGAADVGLYIDGPRGVIRLRFPSQDGDVRVPVSEGLALLRTLPNGAGAEAAVIALRGRTPNAAVS